MTDMLVWATWFLGAVAICLAALLVRHVLDARHKRSQVKWLRQQVDRALQLLESVNRDDVITGLQTLSVLNDPIVRMLARGLITKLINNEDEEIAAQARATLRRFDLASIPEGQPPATPPGSR